MKHSYVIRAEDMEDKNRVIYKTAIQEHMGSFRAAQRRRTWLEQCFKIERHPHRIRWKIFRRSLIAHKFRPRGVRVYEEFVHEELVNVVEDGL